MNVLQRAAAARAAGAQTPQEQADVALGRIATLEQLQEAVGDLATQDELDAQVEQLGKKLRVVYIICTVLALSQLIWVLR